MRIYDYTDFNSCYFGTNFNKGIGEIFSRIRNSFMAPENRPLLTVEHNKGNSVIIAIASCGFYNGKLNFFKKKFEKLNEILKENNSHLLFVRGTDNDPTLFNEGKLETSNIKLLESNCVVKLKNHDVLCIGGSISLDRSWKKSHEKEFGEQLYWENEGANFNETELENTIRDNNITVVVTLDSPTFLSPSIEEFSKNKWLSEDETLKSDCIGNRLKMDTIYKYFVKQQKLPKYWVSNGIKNISGYKINDITFTNKPGTFGRLTNDMDSDIISNDIYAQLKRTIDMGNGWRDLNVEQAAIDAQEMPIHDMGQIEINEDIFYDNEEVQDLVNENRIIPF